MNKINSEKVKFLCVYCFHGDTGSDCRRLGTEVKVGVIDIKISINVFIDHVFKNWEIFYCCII